MRISIWALSLLLISMPSIAQTYNCHPISKLQCDPTACQRDSEGFQASEVYVWDSKTQMLTACMGENCFEGKAKRLQPLPQLKLWAALYSTNPNRSSAPPVFDVLMEIDAQQRFRVLMGDTQFNTLVYGQCDVDHV